MNQTERIQLVEKILDLIGYPDLTAHIAIDAISKVVKLISQGKTVIHHKHIPDDFIEQFKLEGISLEDIEKVKAKRVANKQLIQKKVVLMLERGLTNAYNLEALLVVRESKFLTAEDVKEINAANILNVDKQSFFASAAVSLIQKLIYETSLNPQQIIDKLNSLNRREMKLLMTKIDKHIAVIKKDVITLRKGNITAADALADTIRIAKGENSIYSNIRNPKPIKAARLDPEIINYVSTNKFKASLATIEEELNTELLYSTYADITKVLSSQSVSVASTMLGNLVTWINCFIENHCPAIFPKARIIAIGTEGTIAEDRVIMILSSIISTLMMEKDISMKDAQDEILRVAQNQRPHYSHSYTDLIRDEGWKPEVLRGLFTDEFDAKLKSKIEKEKILTQVHFQLGKFSRAISPSLRSHAESNLMIDRFARWNACNQHNQCPSDEAGIKQLWVSPFPPRNPITPVANTAITTAAIASAASPDYLAGLPTQAFTSETMMQPGNQIPDLVVLTFFVCHLAAKPVETFCRGWAHRLFGKKKEVTKNTEEPVQEHIINIKA